MGNRESFQTCCQGCSKKLADIDLTCSSGVNFSGTPGAAIFNGQIGISIDTEGNVATQYSNATGITTGTASVSGTGYLSVTNAPSIDKLNGPFTQAGGSVAKPIYGVPVAVGGDLMSIPDTDLNTKYYGLTGNLGFGTKGSEMHFEWGETYMVSGSKFNIFDIARTIYHGIMEW